MPLLIRWEQALIVLQLHRGRLNGWNGTGPAASRNGKHVRKHVCRLQAAGRRPTEPTASAPVQPAQSPAACQQCTAASTCCQQCELQHATACRPFRPRQTAGCAAGRCAPKQLCLQATAAQASCSLGRTQGKEGGGSTHVVGPLAAAPVPAAVGAHPVVVIVPSQWIQVENREVCATPPRHIALRRSACRSRCALTRYTAGKLLT